MHPATHPKLQSRSFFDSVSFSRSPFLNLHMNNNKYRNNHRTATLQSRHFCTGNFDEYFLSPAITNSKPGCYLTRRSKKYLQTSSINLVHQASTRLEVQRPQESLNQHQPTINRSYRTMQVTTCVYQVLSMHPHLGTP